MQGPSCPLCQGQPPSSLPSLLSSLHHLLQGPLRCPLASCSTLLQGATHLAEHLAEHLADHTTVQQGESIEQVLKDLEELVDRENSCTPSIPTSSPSKPPSIPYKPPSIPSKPPSIPSIPPSIPSIPPGTPSSQPSTTSLYLHGPQQPSLLSQADPGTPWAPLPLSQPLPILLSPPIEPLWSPALPPSSYSSPPAPPRPSPRPAPYRKGAAGPRPGAGSSEVACGQCGWMFDNTNFLHLHKVLMHSRRRETKVARPPAPDLPPPVDDDPAR